jgi:hypothetical protein
MTIRARYVMEYLWMQQCPADMSISGRHDAPGCSEHQESAADVYEHGIALELQLDD